MSAPIRSRPARCRSIGREPISSPPGQGDPRVPAPGHERSEHHDRRAHLPHEVVGRLDRSDGGGVDRDRVAVPGDGDAEMLEHPAHEDAVEDARHVQERGATRSQDRRRHVLERSVLGARGANGPGQARPPGDEEPVHRLIVGAGGWSRAKRGSGSARDRRSWPTPSRSRPGRRRCVPRPSGSRARSIAGGLPPRRSHCRARPARRARPLVWRPRPWRRA